MVAPDIIDVSLREAGVRSYGLLGETALRAACRGMPPSLIERLGLGDSCGAVVAALPYGEGHLPALTAAGGPLAATAPGTAAATAPGALAIIARFARANWYSELAARLKDAASRICRRLRAEGRDPGPRLAAGRQWRYFVNSRFPEKRLALEAGLGELGLHGLVMLPSHGSAAVLGLLLLPKSASCLLGDAAFVAPYVAGEAPRFSPACESCRACIAACPTGALGHDGSFEREFCLQHWSSVAGSLPSSVEAAWGDRLYGCDSCQEACPKFRPDDAARTTRGVLGPGLPAAWLISRPEAEIRAALKKTALGMSWISIEALKRNARLALSRR